MSRRRPGPPGPSASKARERLAGKERAVDRRDAHGPAGLEGRDDPGAEQDRGRQDHDRQNEPGQAQMREPSRTTRQDPVPTEPGQAGHASVVKLEKLAREAELAEAGQDCRQDPVKAAVTVAKVAVEPDGTDVGGSCGPRTVRHEGTQRPTRAGC